MHFLVFPDFFQSADVVKNKSHVMYEGKHIHFSEVDNKPLCSYSPKLCKQRRLNGYAFCIRHVLEDKTAPFKQCEYVAKYNSQRCTNPIPKSEDRRCVCFMFFMFVCSIFYWGWAIHWNNDEIHLNIFVDGELWVKIPFLNEILCFCDSCHNHLYCFEIKWHWWL